MSGTRPIGIDDIDADASGDNGSDTVAGERDKGAAVTERIHFWKTSTLFIIKY